MGCHHGYDREGCYQYYMRRRMEGGWKKRAHGRLDQEAQLTISYHVVRLRCIQIRPISREPGVALGLVFYSRFCMCMIRRFSILEGASLQGSSAAVE